MNGYWRVMVYQVGCLPFGILLTNSEYEAKGGFQWAMNNLPENSVVVLLNPLGRVFDLEVLEDIEDEAELEVA